ncbi:MAG TPA: MFS transporter [Thermoanaerobaculia bacterium]|nr:MFS transporter [Thermoanaerobaculia bacterium]
MNVISLYLPLWVATSFAGGEVWYAVAYSLSMLVVALLSPLAGVIGDRYGHKRILFACTATAIFFCFFIGMGSRLVPLLMIFAFANIGYQLGLVGYNSLLTSVSTPADRGRTSGIGVALGYVGSFLGMTLVFPFVDGERFAKLPAPLQDLVNRFTLFEMTGEAGLIRANAFIPTAILFAVFSIPIFARVREQPSVGMQSSLHGTLAAVKETFREIVRDKDLRNFFIGSFLYLDAIHTVYIVMATYGKFAAGLRDDQIILVMMIALGAAIAGSAVYGMITDRLPLRTSLYVVLGNWVVALSLALFATSFSTYLPVAIVAGIGLGGIEVVTRVALLGLVDEDRRGRYFGFFNLTGKASSIVGPQLWAVTLFLLADAGPIRFRAGVGVMLLLLVASFAFIRRVDFRTGPRPREVSS